MLNMFLVYYLVCIKFSVLFSLHRESLLMCHSRFFFVMVVFMSLLKKVKVVITFMLFLFDCLKKKERSYNLYVYFI